MSTTTSLSVAVAILAMGFAAPAVAQTVYPPMPPSPGTPYAGSGFGSTQQSGARTFGNGAENGNGNGGLIERAERAIRETPHMAPSRPGTDYGPFGETGRIGGVLNGEQAFAETTRVVSLTQIANSVENAQRHRLGGRDVYGVNGERVGQISGVLSDRATGEVSRIIVTDEGWFGVAGDRVGIPLRNAYLTGEGNVLLNWPSGRVEQMANIDPRRLGPSLDWVELD